MSSNYDTEPWTNCKSLAVETLYGLCQTLLYPPGYIVIGRACSFFNVAAEAVSRKVEVRRTPITKLRW